MLPLVKSGSKSPSKSGPIFIKYIKKRINMKNSVMKKVVRIDITVS